MATRAGFTPAEVREMTLDEVEGLHRYWRRHPPVRDLVAGFVGWKPPTETRDEPASHPNIAMLRAMHPDGFVRG